MEHTDLCCELHFDFDADSAYIDNIFGDKMGCVVQKIESIDQFDQIDSRIKISDIFDEMTCITLRNIISKREESIYWNIILKDKFRMNTTISPMNNDIEIKIRIIQNRIYLFLRLLCKVQIHNVISNIRSCIEIIENCEDEDNGLDVEDVEDVEDDKKENTLLLDLLNDTLLLLIQKKMNKENKDTNLIYEIEEFDNVIEILHQVFPSSTYITIECSVSIKKEYTPILTSVLKSIKNSGQYNCGLVFCKYGNNLRIDIELDTRIEDHICKQLSSMFNIIGEILFYESLVVLKLPAIPNELTSNFTITNYNDFNRYIYQPYNNIIMVVDDALINIKIINRKLCKYFKINVVNIPIQSERWGKHIQYYMFEINDLLFIYVHNGKSALQLFKLFKPSIIITDIEMPKMNGIIFINEVKSIVPTFNRFIIHSALMKEQLADKYSSFDFNSIEILNKGISDTAFNCAFERVILEYV